MIVAVDGPAGSGKSSVCKAVAEQTGFSYIDTGAIYRTIAYNAIKRNCDLKNPKILKELALNLRLESKGQGANFIVLCDDVEMGDVIRTPQVSQATSRIAVYPEVRDAILDLQRRLGRSSNSILEGRDIGSVVFPNAELKIFITASPEVRAQRRLDQLTDQEVQSDFKTVLNEVIERDRRDREREIAPLKEAPGAIILDTSLLTFEEVVLKVADLVIRHN